MKDTEWTSRMIMLLLAFCLVFLAWHILHKNRINVLAERILAIERKGKP